MLRNIYENISTAMNPFVYDARHRLRKEEWHGRIFKPRLEAAKAMYKLHKGWMKRRRAYG